MKKLLLFCASVGMVLPMSADNTVAVDLPFFTDFSQKDIGEKFTIIDVLPISQAKLPFTWVIGTESVDVNGANPVAEMMRLDNEKPEWRDGIDNMMRAAAVFNGYRVSTKEYPDLQGNDYLITPAFKGKKNATYTISFAAGTEFVLGGTSNGCNMDIYVGDAPTVEGIRKNKIASIKDIQYYELGGDPTNYNYTYTFVPEEDGIFYVGFHSVALPNRRFWINSINIDTEYSDLAPADVSGLKAVAAEKGEHKVVVSFTSPSKNYVGENLTEITSIDIFRDDVEEAVKKFPTPAIGKELSFEDTFEGMAENPAGSHTYRVVCRNSSGSSIGESVRTWVGEDHAAAVRNLRISETDRAYKLAWERPKSSVNGGYVDYDNLSYSILLATDNGDDVTDFETLGTTNKLEYSVDKERYASGQYIVTLKVVSVTESGSDADRSFATVEAVGGESYSLPFAESFVKGAPESFPWSVNDVLEENSEHHDAWTFAQEDAAKYQLISQDADGGHAAFSNNALPKYSMRLLSPKMIMKADEEITLVFYTGCVGVENHEDNELQVELCANGTYTPVGEPMRYSGSGWEKHTLKLKNNTGLKDCRISFKATGRKDVSMLLDNISVTGESGVGTVPAEENPVAVTVCGGDIIITGACDYEIYTVSGLRMAIGKTDRGDKLAVPAGVYIVKADDKVYKCVVK